MQFESAERLALKALTVAAGAGQSVRGLAAEIHNREMLLFPVLAPRVWLFSLKALAFIYLRAQRHEDSRELVAKLQQLDPNHDCGW